MSDQSQHSQRADRRIQAALGEYLERIDRGEVVNRDEFLARHSEIADALRSFFAAEEPLRKIAATKTSNESAAISTQSIAAQGQETVPPKLQPGGSLGTSGRGLAGKFGRYEILRALGKGAMGAVYLAQDTQLKRQVAIKTPHLEEDPTGELLKRFYQEAEAAATLRHANICPVHDVGQIDGKHFISMAYIEGRSLSDLIKNGKLQNERHILIAVYKLARALQQAHDRGIVHRDLKPANIMVDKQGEPMIMDFGLARKRRAEGEASLTHSGVILGSPAYMSPEQIEGDPESVGPASDQYSLGVVLYEMLTGQLPFRGSVVNVLAQIITKGPTPPGELRPGLDPRIETVCLRMMAKKASERFPSMKAVADELATIVKNPAAAPVPTPIAVEKSPTVSGPPAAPRPTSAEAGASQVGQSLNQRSISPSDVTSIEEPVRKCLRRRDYDQMIQIIERIPEDRRNTALQTLLEQAREKVDEIAFLICEIDEAVRLKDWQAALRKAEALLTIKPGHHRAKAIQEKYAGYGNGAAARIGILRKFTQPWNEGGWIPWGVLAFGLAVFAGMYGVIVISLGNNKTAIVIDAKDPGITVEVNDRHATINVPGEQSIQVEPGDQSVKVSYAGLETVTKGFTLAKDKTKRLTVRLVDNKLLADLEGEPRPTIAGTEKVKNAGTVPAEPKGPSPRTVAAAPPVTPASPPPKNDGFVPLFNGKDLTGWKTNPDQPDNWRVENGILTGSGQRVSDLFTSRADFKDFHLRVEARINDGGNSGVFFRVQPNSGGRYEAQINSTHRDPNKTGSLYPQSNNVIVAYGESLVPAGDWFNMDVIAVKNHIVVTVNGITTVDYYDSDRHFFAGAIGLQLHNPQTVVEFRKIEIKELPAASVAEAPSEATDGFVPLFNGKDLTGWKTNPDQPDNWRVENGILTGSGQRVSDLFTSRADFKDFHLRVEARINDGGNSGVFFRVQPNSGGRYEAQINSTHRDPNKTGSLYPQSNNVIVAYGESLVPAGDWFNMDVIAVKNHIVVTVNGITTVDYYDSDRRFFAGAIGLQLHNPQTVVEFRKIEIKELPAESATGAPAPDGFVPLFNGKDLHGWIGSNGQPAAWRVFDGELEVVPGQGNIMTTQDFGPDFQLHAEFNIPLYADRKGQARGNSGIFLLGRYEIQILDSYDNFQPAERACAALYGAIGPSRNACRPPNEWQTFDITFHAPRSVAASSIVKHGELTVVHNGVPVIVKRRFGAPSAGARFRDVGTRGPILLQDHGSAIRFRNLAIKQLAAAPSPKPLDDADFVPLFNGKDLTGWKTHPSQPGNWRVENGILVGSGPGLTSHLYTERGDFKDFHLRVEARINEGGNSGVYFRAVFGPAQPADRPRWLVGYNAKLDERRLGAFILDDPTLRVPLIRNRVPEPPAGRWIVLEVLARGNHFVIKTDGEITAEYTDDTRRFSSGYIALQQHTPRTRVEFRKIEIEELSPQNPSASVPNKGATSTPIDARDPFQPKSIWFSDNPRHVLTVIERKGAMFRARFEVGPNITRMIKGTVKDGKVDWFAKDVRAIRGKVGGDNHGTITSDDLGDKIDFVWGLHGRQRGEFTLRLRN